MLLGVILSAAVTSCKLTQKAYKAPQVDVQQMLGSQVGADTASTVSEAWLNWRSYFKDAQLQSLIEEGLKNNYDLQSALYRIEQASASLKQAKQAYFPNVGVGIMDTHNRTSYKDANDDTKVLSNYTNRYSIGLQVQWELNVWGKLSAQKRASYAQFLQTMEARNLVQTNVVAGVATYYYTLLSLDEQLRVTKESIALLKETLDTYEQMWKAGQVNAAAVEQTRATLHSTELNVPALEMNIRKTENALSVLLGRTPGRIERGTFATQTVPAEMDAGIPIQMLAQRPDVKSAELAFRSAFELTNVARANMYPTLSLSSATVGFGSGSLSGIFKPENLFLSVVGGIVQPLFYQGQLSAGLRSAKAAQEIALLSFKKAVNEAGAEVSDILFTYQNSLKKNEIRDKQIAALQKSVSYTHLLRNAGEANYLEIISAETSLLQAKLGRVNDKLEQLQASVNLYKALGGGVQ